MLSFVAPVDTPLQRPTTRSLSLIPKTTITQTMLDAEIHRSQEAYRDFSRKDSAPLERKRNELKSLAELKESGETKHTMTDSTEPQTHTEKGPKQTLCLNEIDCLLTDFKAKFASIQQKYSMPNKSNDRTPVLVKPSSRTPQTTLNRQSIDFVNTRPLIEPFLAVNTPKTPQGFCNTRQSF